MSEDVWLALVVCGFVLVMFGLSLLVPRKVKPTRAADAQLLDTSRRIEDIDARLKTAEHDLKGVRMAVGGLATKESVHQVALSMAEMRGDMKALTGATSTTTRTVERIEAFLMESAAKTIAEGNTKEVDTKS